MSDTEPKCSRCGRYLAVSADPNTGTCSCLLQDPSVTYGPIPEDLAALIGAWSNMYYVPDGARRRECYETEDEIVVIGWPGEDDESHDCDEMGCSSVSHVLYRFPKATLYKLESRWLAALRRENERLAKELDRIESFSPTPEQTNALPYHIRNYIHLVESRCDPAGDIRELVIARDTIQSLLGVVAENDTARAQVAAMGETIGSAMSILQDGEASAEADLHGDRLGLAPACAECGNPLGHSPGCHIAAAQKILFTSLPAPEAVAVVEGAVGIIGNKDKAHYHAVEVSLPIDLPEGTPLTIVALKRGEGEAVTVDTPTDWSARRKGFFDEVGAQMMDAETKRIDAELTTPTPTPED